MAINEGRAEKAVEFIRDHAERLGELIGACKALEHKRKVVQGQAFLEADGTVAERDAKAHTSTKYREVVEEIGNAWAEKETLATRLKAAELTIDVWRSQNSAAKRGHV